jgi:hypothetical protein
MLVTVDVAGVWDGTWATDVRVEGQEARRRVVIPVTLKLQQSGQTVTGDITVRAIEWPPRAFPGMTPRSGPVTGILHGDVLRLTFGASAGREFDLRVDRDEMQGRGYGFQGHGEVELRRAPKSD